MTYIYPLYTIVTYFNRFFQHIYAKKTKIMTKNNEQKKPGKPHEKRSPGWVCLVKNWIFKEKVSATALILSAMHTMKPSLMFRRNEIQRKHVPYDNVFSMAFRSKSREAFLSAHFAWVNPWKLCHRPAMCQSYINSRAAAPREPDFLLTSIWNLKSQIKA